MLRYFSCVCLFVTLWTLDCQAPLSMGFSRQEYQGGLPFPTPGDLPNSGIKPRSPVSPALQADSLPLSHRCIPSIVIRLFVFFFKGWLYCLIALNHSSGFLLYLCLSVHLCISIYLSIYIYDIQTQCSSFGYNSLPPTCLVEFLYKPSFTSVKNLTLPGQ